MLAFSGHWVWVLVSTSCFFSILWYSTEAWVNSLTPICWIIHVSHWARMVDIGQYFLDCCQGGTSLLFDNLSNFSVALMVFVSWADIVTFAKVVELYTSLFFAISNWGRSIFSFFLDELNFWSRVLLSCRVLMMLLRWLFWLGLMIDIHWVLLLLLEWLAKFIHVQMIGILTLNALARMALKNALYFIGETSVFSFSGKLWGRLLGYSHTIELLDVKVIRVSSIVVAFVQLVNDFIFRHGDCVLILRESLTRFTIVHRTFRCPWFLHEFLQRRISPL